MTHTEQLDELRVSATLAIILYINENGNIKLVDLDEEDWRENEDTFEAFYELPQEQVMGKYYATPHYIHYAYLEDGKLYFNGLDDEADEGFVFDTDGLHTGTLCYIADNYLN